MTFSSTVVYFVNAAEEKRLWGTSKTLLSPESWKETMLQLFSEFFCPLLFATECLSTCHLVDNYRMIAETSNPTDEIGCDSLESGDVFGTMQVEKGAGLRVVFRVKIVLFTEVEIDGIDESFEQLFGVARWIVGIVRR